MTTDREQHAAAEVEPTPEQRETAAELYAWIDVTLTEDLGAEADPQVVTDRIARRLATRESLARAAGEAEAIRFAVRNIEQSTGPTGGWLRSPANLIENLTGERPAPDPGDGPPWGDGGMDRTAGE